ncbi:outer membrane channel protein [Grimontia celer]|uniref:Outer membrane channel protein n=1 Tax=Grimontia celer TaxID=1796497 RepID=A0A128F6X2_9GAMM|nr:TolC family protein [Grimontia celer]CZF82543.1 outer membrane channel protein [Grimontia celer]
MLARKSFLIRLIFALTLLPGMATAEPMTFEQAWHSVLTRNDAIAAERANVQRAEHMRNAASAHHLPSVSLSGNYTRLDQNVELKPSQLAHHMNGGDALGQIAGSVPQLGPLMGNLDNLLTTTLADRDIYTSSIRAIWPIFTGGRILAAEDIANAQREEAKFLMQMAQQAKFEDLAKVYFATVLAEQVLQTRIEMEQGLAKHLDHAKKMEEQGQIARVERLQAEVSFDKARTERRKAERDLEIAQAALQTLVKSDAPVTPSSALFTQKHPPAMAPFMEKTLADYPGLKVLDAKGEQADGLVNLEKGKYYPQVYLYGNYNLYEGDSLTAELAPDWAVGVGVSIPLIDNGGRSDKVKAAHSTALQVQYLRAQAEQDLSLLVEKTWREAGQALEEYQGLASSISLAQENLRLREKAFAQGLSTSLDVVDAELYLASIKTQQLAASYQYVLSLSRLLAISGEMHRFPEFQSASLQSIQPLQG